MLKLSPVQTDATLLDVTCCVYLHTLLHVVARSLKPVKLLSPVQTDGTLFANNSNIVGFYMLRPFAHPIARASGCYNFQNCWANNVGNYCVRLHVALSQQLPTLLFLQ